MSCWRVCALLAAALVLPLGSGSAAADTWPAPADLPPGTWYGEAPTGWYDVGDSREPLADALTALPGARLLVKYARTWRPDGSTGPAWFWFNTRAGSTFSLTGCPEVWPAHAAPVTRKRLLAAVRSRPERGFDIEYDAERNAGSFEVGAVEFGEGPGLPGCRRADVLTEELPRPAWVGQDRSDGVVLWAEGRGFEGSNDDSEGASLQVHEGEWLVVSWRPDEWQHEWYSTRGPSTYLLNFCDVDGNRYNTHVTRWEFLQRVANQSTQHIWFLYDEWRDVGMFQVSSWFDEYCEVRPR